MEWERGEEEGKERERRRRIHPGTYKTTDEEVRVQPQGRHQSNIEHRL